MALTVLPSTDLYLMGRNMGLNLAARRDASAPATPYGVNCSLSTNNVLNPFTPFGDCSLVRMANLYANTSHVGARKDIRECFNMITTRSAKLLRLNNYGLEVGKSADLVVFDCTDPESAVANSFRRCLASRADDRPSGALPANCCDPTDNRQNEGRHFLWSCERTQDTCRRELVF